MKIYIVLMFLVLISGCVVGPDYERPEISTPKNWINKDSLNIKDSTALAIADTSWWRLFGDTVLTDLINTGLKENTDIKIAAARVEQYLAYYGISRSYYYPELNLNGSVKAGKNSSKNTGTENNPFRAQYDLNLSAGWEVDLWGRIKRLNESARADLFASEESRQGLVLLITAQISSSYIDLLTVKKQLEITKRTVASREEALRLFRLRFEKGEISMLEVSQLESDFWNVMSFIPLYEKQIVQIQNNINVLIGKNPGFIPEGLNIDSLDLPDVPDYLPSSILEQRPDIRFAEDLLISANANIGAVKALYYPRLSLSGTLGLASNDLSEILNPASQIWNLAANIFAPLFNAGRTKSQVEVAEAQKKQALFAYVNSVRSAFRDAENALIDRSRTQQQLELLGNNVDALALYKSLAQMNFDQGVKSYLEVLDAERTLFDAEIYYIATKGNLLKSVVNIYSAFGGSWVSKASMNAYQPYDMKEVKKLEKTK